MTKYGRKVRNCLYDNKPCERPQSPLDGDYECGDAIWFNDENNDVVVLRPICSRLNLKEVFKK